MNLEFDNSALLLIDIQYGLDDWEYYGGNRNNPQAEENAKALLQKWRTLKLPVFHVQHSSQNPKSPLHPSKAGFAIKNEVLPIKGEPIISKNVNSAFIGTDLEEQLNKDDISIVVIAGLTSNHCISTSVRMASNLGFKTYLIADATATFDSIAPNGDKFDSEIIHQTTLASLNEEFATILNTQDLLSSL